MTDFQRKRRNFAIELFKCGVLKFGEFKIKSGIMSPVYCDFRVLVNFPDMMISLSDLLCTLLCDSSISFDKLCGVPYTALPIAAIMSTTLKKPMLVRRKEKKDYGTKKLIEGLLVPNETCLIVEDVITSGSSILETTQDLLAEKLTVTNAVIIMDREQGGRKILEKHNVNVSALFTMSSFLSILLEEKLIDDTTMQNVQQFIAANQITSIKKEGTDNECGINSRICLPFEKRVAYAKNDVAKKLMDIIIKKQSVLCVAVDVTTSAQFLKIVEKVGGAACMIKTHVDILVDFTPDVAKRLKQLSVALEFLICEDRKFADIGNTVHLQLTAGLYKISSWADIVTMHSVSGEGVLEVVRRYNMEHDPIGVFLLAEMSSSNNLLGPTYSQQTVEMASNFNDVVVGFVSQSKDHVRNPGFLQLTPGVSLVLSKDNLDQTYSGVDEAVLVKCADIVVVGRGITMVKDYASAAEGYRSQSWQAYKKRVK